MISRRIIRVKVMQTIYALDAAGEPNATTKNPAVLLEKSFENTTSLIVYILKSIIAVAVYAEQYSKQKASKNITTTADLNVNVKIAGNKLIWTILENESFRKLTDKTAAFNTDSDIIKKEFLELIQSDAYKNYIAEEERTDASETKIVEHIYNQLMLSESFNSHLEEKFINWDDDAEMVQQLVLQSILKPASLRLTKMLTPDKKQYAFSLLETVQDKKAYLLEMITPKLKNWDPDRIALLDMLLLQMGISELLYFETIPTKVTINEYIDIAKEYSTPQSGQFVNGILDNIHKELMTTGKINKIDFIKKQH